MAYELPNHDGNSYDFGDPEYWESYGLAPYSASLFAEGFPQYWQDVAGWYRSAEFIAEYHRRLNYFSLACYTPCYYVVTHAHLKPFVQSPASDEQMAKRYASSSSSPFNCLFPIERAHYNPFAYANEYHAEPTIDLWYALARCLIDSLHDADIPKTPLPHGYKRRERLTDGAIYCGRTRLARQDILELCTDDQALTSDEQAQAIPVAKPRVRPGPSPGIRWGPLRYHLDVARKRHFLVAGMPRSGKTSLLRLLIQSTFLYSKVRCIVYDFKRDLLPKLNPSRKRKLATQYYYLLNPFDSRGVAWDIAKDVTAQSASTLAQILIPTPTVGHDGYFLRVSRQLLAATIRVLIDQAGQNWTFLDLMLAIQRENIRSVLSTTSEGRRQYNAHVQGDGQTQQNVLSALEEYSQRYLRVAAAWAKAKETLSLSQWVTSESKGIVIGNSIRHHAAFQPINQAILHFLFCELLDQKRPKEHHTFMVLDEFTRLGRLPIIEDVLEAAPSQGLSLVLGVHDISTLTNVYGKSANGILGACGFRAYLRVANSETARWISDQIGAQDVMVEQTSTSQSRSKTQAQQEDHPSRHATGSATTRTYQRITRPAVPPETIMQLPLTTCEDGLDAFFLGPGHPPYRGHLSPGDLFRWNKKRNQFPDVTHTLWQPGPRGYLVSGKYRTFSEEPFYPTPEDNFRPPDDHFCTLKALGFEYDSDPPTKPLPPLQTPTLPPDIVDPSPTQTPHNVTNNFAPKTPATPKPSPTPSDQPPQAPPPKKHNLKDLVWDDDLETFQKPDQ